MSFELSRKQFLRASGTALTAGLAGCNALSSSDSAPTTTGGTTPSSSTPAGGGIGSVGTFYVGGSSDESTGPAAVDGRAEVVSLRPNAATGKDPVVMVPGLGLSPYIYLTTPDGRPGWAELFAAAGHPTYLFNPPRNVGSGGLDTAAFQDDDPPSLSRWSLDRAWPTWGFGPEVGEPYDDVRYPVDHVDQLVASFPAYVSTGGGGGGNGSGGGQRGGRGSSDGSRTNDTASGGGAGSGGGGGGGGGGSGQGGASRFASSREVGALESLLDAVGSATLLVHSAGGASGFAVAQSVPDLVERIVAVEPVGCPTDEETVAAMGGDAPVMTVYGDYVEQRGQTGRKTACATTVDLAADAATASTMLSLPDEGIAGNTHLLMQDDNNDVIADRITSWLG